MGRVDCHLHLMAHSPENLIALADQYAYDQFCVLGIPCMGQPLNNLECLMVKKLAPGRAFAFGGFTYEQGVQKDLGSQLKDMMLAGFDGVKFIETKPNMMKQIGIGLDEPFFEALFQTLEEEQIPIMWHVGDPASFWDLEKAPAFAIENGWCYQDESFPSLKALYRQAENVLSRHPRLKICFAHFYFCGDDRAHAQRILDCYENVFFDLTPGTEMYPQFMADPMGWKPFFEKYSDRILFGTDGTDNRAEADIYAHLLALMQSFLESAEPFRVWDIKGRGFGLDKDCLERIYTRNFSRFVGSTPKALNLIGIERLAKQLDIVVDQAGKAPLQALLCRLSQG